jgi:spermidine synthase
MKRWFVLFFAAATGYISLSQEMVWMRAVSYMTGGEPTVFAHVLGFFLLGVAGGALFGEKLCDKRPGAEWTRAFIGGMLMVSGAFYYVSVAGVAQLMTNPSLQWLGSPAIYLACLITSFLLGGIFTVLCHGATRLDEAVGVTVSRIYLANIIGSTAGPLLTGFVLMEYRSTDQIVLYLAAGSAALGALALMCEAESRALAGVGVCFFGLLLGMHGAIYHDLLAKLQYKSGYAPGIYKYLVEKRSGIISVQPGRVDPNGGPNWPDMIYGGGIYDGRFNIDPANKWYDPTSTDDELRHPFDISNYICRAYMIAGLHPHPTDVLEVGLSSASWNRVLANDVMVKHITSVEINAGYKDVIAHYPDQASILHDPKVDVVIDDGRRWLNRNPDKLFDFILQNTTWHWRAESTNLLSVEYLRLSKAHLKPGGVVYWNTTFSEDAKRTAAEVFKYVTHYNNFVAGSDSPFNQTPDQIRANLLQFTITGREGDPKTFETIPSYIAPDRRDRYAEALGGALATLSAETFPDEAPALRKRSYLFVITDDNMATEFKRERSDSENGLWRLRVWLKERMWWHFFRARR